jgi:hypothetical protein
LQGGYVWQSAALFSETVANPVNIGIGAYFLFQRYLVLETCPEKLALHWLLLVCSFPFPTFSTGFFRFSFDIFDCAFKNIVVSASN